MKRSISFVLAITLFLVNAVQSSASDVVCFQAFKAENKTARNAIEIEKEEKHAFSNNKIVKDTRIEKDIVLEATPKSKHLETENYADKVFELVNLERTKRGLKILKSNPALNAMANIRSKELSQKYSHMRPNGTSCTTIFDEVESDLIFYGENAAKGQKTPEKVMEAWMNSKGHKENILREESEYLAVGIFKDDNDILHWIQIFSKD